MGQSAFRLAAEVIVVVCIIVIIKAGAEAGAELGAEPEAGAEAGAEPGAELGAEPGAEPDAEPDAELEPDTELELVAEPEPSRGMDLDSMRDLAEVLCDTPHEIWAQVFGFLSPLDILALYRCFPIWERACKNVPLTFDWGGFPETFGWTPWALTQNLLKGRGVTDCFAAVSSYPVLTTLGCDATDVAKIARALDCRHLKSLVVLCKGGCEVAPGRVLPAVESLEIFADKRVLPAGGGPKFIRGTVVDLVGFEADTPALRTLTLSGKKDIAAIKELCTAYRGDFDSIRLVRSALRAGYCELIALC